MDALVADVAVACIPEPVPVIQIPISGVVAHWRGAQKEVPIEPERNRFRGRVPDGYPALIADAARHVDLPYDAAVQQVHGALLMRYGAALHADLHDTLVLARRRHHGAAFEQVVTGRLLAIDVLAGLTRPYSGQRVPMIGGGDGHRVHVFVLKELAQILVNVRFSAFELLDDLRGALGLRLIHIADGDRSQTGA